MPAFDESELEPSELSPTEIRLLDEVVQKNLLFKAIRACDLRGIRNILQADRDLLNKKLYGYEGSDILSIIQNSKNSRCYFYTGQEKQGYFYPLHVATESGHKNLTMLLVKAGADTTLLDYRGQTAEEKSNGAARHAFYELQGLKFDSKERYQGKLDRQGNRHGQGILFYKPEGYTQEERQLYRGSFKNNLYHGPGTLYHPGTDVVAYSGRWKNGLKHGRGIDFDKEGNKIYDGSFREDKRDGKGEEYQDNILVYRGELFNNMRHGFGIAYFPENSRYFGRFENNLMNGLGIYCHSNGDRFEGMFYNNKPDGPGSFYERDLNNPGHWNSSHAIWQGGRKVKETNVPFIPTTADLPEDINKTMLTDIINANQDMGDGDLGVNLMSPEAIAALKTKATSNTSNSFSFLKPPSKKSIRSSFSYFDVEAHQHGISRSDWWKIQLGKYLKLPLTEAMSLGLPVSDLLLADLTSREDNEKSKEDDEDKEDTDDEIDEILGSHFMDVPALFVAYAYVNSASKIFAERLERLGSNRFNMQPTDFEAVNYLVADAIETYNDTWETAYKNEQTRIFLDYPPGSSSSQLETRRQMFMSEKEKKEEMLLKQRAELAIKKGTAELDSNIEQMIGQEILESLVEEIEKLVVLNKPTVDMNQINVQLAEKLSNPPMKNTKNEGGNYSPVKRFRTFSNQSDGGDRSLVSNSRKAALDELSLLDIEDLLEINDLDAYINQQLEGDQDEISPGSDSDPTRNNEYAEELLNLIHQTVSLT